MFLPQVHGCSSDGVRFSFHPTVTTHLGDAEMRSHICLAIVGFAILLLSASGSAQDATPGFNTKIPEWVLTPDTVETRIGTLEFFDGIPNEKSAKALFANLDLNRALQAIFEWNAGVEFPRPVVPVTSSSARQRQIRRSSLTD